MDELLALSTALLLAHLLTDFMFQPRRMVEVKLARNLRCGWLYLHAAAAGLLAWSLSGLLAGQWTAHELLWVTALTHLLIDAGKIALQKHSKPERETALFFGDQLLHLLVIAGLVAWVAGLAAIQNLWTELPLQDAAVLLLAVVFLLQPCSIIMQKLLALFPSVLSNEPAEPGKLPDELPLAGQWIGYAERLLILIFVLIGQFTAIGFLVAAKSILRFGSEQKQGPKSEYVLLGTLFSFTIALLTALATRALLG